MRFGVDGGGVMGKPKKQQAEPGRVPGYVIGELSDYFAHEDIGPPAVVPEPRAGTVSSDPKPPQWGHGADPVIMAVVYRRLSWAQTLFPGKNIFAVLRARYGHIAPRDKTAGDQSKERVHASTIDRAEELYLHVRSLFPVVRMDARRQVDARWERLFGQGG